MAGSASTFFFSSRRRHTRLQGDWSSDVCSSDLGEVEAAVRPADHIVGPVQSLALVPVDQHLAAAVSRPARHAPMAALADHQAALQVECRAVALAGLRAQQLGRLARRHPIELAPADVDEVVEAVRMPERPLGEDEPGGQPLGLCGLEHRRERVGHRPQPRRASRRFTISALGTAPTILSFSTPSLKNASWGIACTPNRAASAGCSSTFTLPIVTWSPSSRAISSSTGAMARHGPHHGAQKSITTGCSLVTTPSKVACVTCTVIALIPRPLRRLTPHCGFVAHALGDIDAPATAALASDPRTGRSMRS